MLKVCNIHINVLSTYNRQANCTNGLAWFVGLGVLFKIQKMDLSTYYLLWSYRSGHFTCNYMNYQSSLCSFEPQDWQSSPMGTSPNFYDNCHDLYQCSYVVQVVCNFCVGHSLCLHMLMCNQPKFFTHGSVLRFYS